MFTVKGIPAPQGSLKAIVNQHTGKATSVASPTSNYIRYRADIRERAQNHQRSEPILQGAVHLTLIFAFPRPEGHWLPANSRRVDPVLRPGAPKHKANKPDLDKLCRSVMDALTGICYRDDEQVGGITTAKVWSDEYHSAGETMIVIQDLEEM
jgi:crossover junction endodeoxyribonuclease RusA